MKSCIYSISLLLRVWGVGQAGKVRGIVLYVREQEV